MKDSVLERWRAKQDGEEKKTRYVLIMDADTYCMYAECSVGSRVPEAHSQLSVLHAEKRKGLRVHATLVKPATHRACVCRQAVEVSLRHATTVARH